MLTNSGLRRHEAVAELPEHAFHRCRVGGAHAQHQLLAAGQRLQIRVLVLKKDMRPDEPDRVVNVGIAEQNMLGVAAGMAKVGLVPFISTFVAFALHRPLDQIRVLIAQTGANVKITAGYCGLFTGKAGKTHQIVDDISVAESPTVIPAPILDLVTSHSMRLTWGPFMVHVRRRWRVSPMYASLGGIFVGLTSEDGAQE